MSVQTSASTSTILTPTTPSRDVAAPAATALSRRTTFAALAVALLPTIVLAIWRWGDGFGITAGDWAQYMLHARALLAHRHYADIGYLYSRFNPWVGPPAEPPGLPLTLVPVMALFGPSIAAGHVLMLGSLLAGLTCVWFYFAPRHGSGVATVIVAVSGVALVAQGAVNNVLADAGFFALVWAVMLIVDRDEPLTLRQLALVTALGALAVAYRTAGAALAPALVLYAIVARKPRALLPVAVWGALGLAFILRMGTAANVLSAVSTNPRAIFSTLREHVSTYGHALPFAVLRPVVWTGALRAYQIVALAIVAVGAVVLLRSRWRTSFAVAFGVSYVAMLAMVIVQEGRYLWPITPLVAAAFVVGARWIAGRVAGARARMVATTAAVAVVGAALVVEGTRPRVPDLTDLPQVRRIFAYADSLHRVEDVHFVFANPRVLTWYTGVPAMTLFRASPSETLDELRNARITHVVLGDVGDLPEQNQAMRQFVTTHPADFRFERREGQFEVYRFLAPPAATGGR